MLQLMNTRINSILQFYNTNSSKFAEEIGVQKSSISHVLSGRNKPSLDFIQKILKTFPEINADWLILGKGKMIVVDEQKGLFKNSAIDKKIDVNAIKKKQPDDEETMRQSKTLVDIPESVSKEVANTKAKTANKIVIFYSDNTFTEYFPENF
jgi:transcriptional regulator with XRE-family HTH domain